ncbi:MAG: ATP-binding protein [Deltaproteobacteria bacterium]|nr:ATP-binding protein [Deltaproteobacteria bacterium]
MEFAASTWEQAKYFNDRFPCVTFEAKPSMEITWVSENVKELFGLHPDDLIRQPQFWKKHVVVEDWFLFQEKLFELENCGAVSFIHRLGDVCGLPIWLTHSLCKVERNDEIFIHGCLIPVGGEPRILALNQEIVAQFIHKLGNHFQLLNLIVNSLKNSPPNFRDVAMIQETLDQAINLTRIFSDCNQALPSVSDISLSEVARAAAESRIATFAAAGVHLQLNLDEMPGDMTIASDPYLLETALGHILQNAREAINGSGNVEIEGRFIPGGLHGVARLNVRDTGCGIPAGEVERVVMPFYSTKKGHEGLGLTLASRIIELHGGGMRIKSCQGMGTEVEVLLPTEQSRDIFCA